MENETASEQQTPAPKWEPLSAVDRRVAGVLIEKAKTTPGQYPMSLNAVTTGCNQKSNRSPAMNLEPEDVEESLDRLRRLGAVGLIEGHGRVSKYRHYLYEWLGVEKAELAVMAELLLRGPQTLGELRSRAARMDPIRDLAELEPIVESLKSKGLVLPLNRQGRGHVVSHALFRDSELDRIKAEYSDAGADRPAPAAPAPAPVAAAPTEAAEDTLALRREIDQLRAELAELRGELESLTTAQEKMDREVQQLRDELGG